MYESASDFCQRFLWRIEEMVAEQYPNEKGLWENKDITDFDLLSKHLSTLCRDRKIVLVIDEVDRASNFRIFLMFLSMLRDKFSERDDGIGATFHSVILVGVVDVKNIKFKMSSAGFYAVREGEGMSVSPWNIAANFKVDMSFDPSEIATMLRQYEEEHKTGMDIMSIAEEIYWYTSGYPFMVSRICQIIEEEIERNWTKKGVQEAVKVMLVEKNTLFDDMSKNLENHDELREFVRAVLIDGVVKPFSMLDVCVDFGVMYGYFKNVDNRVAISNRVFEICMSNYFILRDGRTHKQITGVLKEDVVRDGRFDMELCLVKFARHYHELFADRDTAFLERHGRLLFLSYLQPLLNGTGFYHIESETRNTRRMDVVVDYGSEQFIIELKRWYGDVAHDKAYKQLLGYMEAKGMSEGYLLTFDFSKNSKTYEPGWVEVKGISDFASRRIFDIII